MGSAFASCRFIFSILLLISRGIYTREIKEKNGNNNVIDNVPIMLDKHMHQHIALQKDPTLNVYFNLEDLKIGNKIPIYFSLKNTSKSPHLLPRDESDSIPFSLSHLPKILDFFSFPKHSPQAKAMENTLSECEDKPLRGETKFCATSLESMLDSTRGAFGLDANFKVLTTNFVSEHSVDLQNYTILEEVEEVVTPRMLACHTMPYPYRVYYCHGQESDHKLFNVKFEGENGERVDAFGVCHMDTSQWDPDHVAFKVVGTWPGAGPVCHFFPAENLIWVVTTSTI